MKSFLMLPLFFRTLFCKIYINRPGIGQKFIQKIQDYFIYFTDMWNIFTLRDTV